MRVELEDVTLEVEDHGEGVPVMLLHGFPLSSEIWAPVRPAIEQTARLITPDLRGFGRSDKPRGPYALEVLAGDVIALADALGLDRFVVGGHSMGGYVALRVAERLPSRLAGLVLVDTRAESDTAEGRASREASIRRIENEGPTGFLDDFVPNLVGPTTRDRAPRFLRDLRAIADEVPSHALAGCLRGMAERPDSGPLLRSLNVPALVLVGAEDTITPQEAAQAMAAALPQAIVAVIPAAGHTPSVERPVAVADAMVAFLKALARSAPSGTTRPAGQR